MESFIYEINNNDLQENEIEKLNKEFKSCLYQNIDDIDSPENIHYNFEKLFLVDKYNRLKEKGSKKLDKSNLKDVSEKFSLKIIKKILFYFYSGVIQFYKKDCVKLIKHSVMLKSKILIKEIQKELVFSETGIIDDEFFLEVSELAFIYSFYFNNYEKFINDMIKNHEIFQNIKEKNNLEYKYDDEFISTILKGIDFSYKNKEKIDSNYIKKKFILTYGIQNKKFLSFLSLKDFFDNKLPIKNDMRIYCIKESVNPLFKELNNLKEENKILEKNIKDIKSKKSNEIFVLYNFE